MAGELNLVGADTTTAHRFVARDAISRRWNGAAWEAWNPTNIATYLIAATLESGSTPATPRYVGDLPAGAAALAVAVDLYYWTGLLAGSYITESGPLKVSLATTQSFNNTGQTTLLPANVDGAGTISVDSNTGGTDALRYVDAQDVGIGGADVRIYLATDWPASPANVQAKTATNADGRWGPLLVNPGTYVAVFNKQGVSGPDVSASFTV